MQIIKIRAKFSREIEDDIRSDMDDVQKELEDLPKEVREGIDEMAHIAAMVRWRMENAKAISPIDVAKFNRLAYRICPHCQDGEEFRKVLRPNNSKIEFRPLKLKEEEPAETPSVKVYKSSPDGEEPKEKKVQRFCFNGETFELIPDAHWIRTASHDTPYSCSNCCRAGYSETKFCPYCGAKMEDKA